jgi:thioredoxin-like negative regulator of GroEL
MTLTPDPIETGWTLFGEGDLFGAQRAIRPLLKGMDTPADALSLMAMILREVGDDSAPTVLAAAKLQDKDGSVGHWRLGLACEALGDLDGAVEALETGLEDHPRDVELRLMLAKILIRQRQFDAAEAHALALVAAAPRHREAIRVLSEAQAGKDA